jgi:hypothetical protein
VRQALRVAVRPEAQLGAKALIDVTFARFSTLDMLACSSRVF